MISISMFGNISMNKHQSFLGISALLFALLNNTVSFGMKKQDIMGFDFGELKILKEIPELGLNVVNILEDPKTFGGTNKHNHLLVKKLGRRNLEEIYKNQNPKFLLNHYVPILFVDADLIIRDCDEYFGNFYGQPIVKPREKSCKNYVASVN